jgi:hypothetical protein
VELRSITLKLGRNISVSVLFVVLLPAEELAVGFRAALDVLGK